MGLLNPRRHDSIAGLPLKSRFSIMEDDFPRCHPPTNYMVLEPGLGFLAPMSAKVCILLLG